jgi:hypothetical protein
MCWFGDYWAGRKWVTRWVPISASAILSSSLPTRGTRVYSVEQQRKLLCNAQTTDLQSAVKIMREEMRLESK